jgi:hypothetical protein
VVPFCEKTRRSHTGLQPPSTREKRATNASASVPSAVRSVGRSRVPRNEPTTNTSEPETATSSMYTYGAKPVNDTTRRMTTSRSSLVKASNTTKKEDSSISAPSDPTVADGASVPARTRTLSLLAALVRVTPPVVSTKVEGGQGPPAPPEPPEPPRPAAPAPPAPAPPAATVDAPPGSPAPLVDQSMPKRSAQPATTHDAATRQMATSVLTRGRLAHRRGAAQPGVSGGVTDSRDCGTCRVW